MLDLAFKCIYSEYIPINSVKHMKTITRAFKSGNSIAVRIPREFNVKAGKTFEIKRQGKALILTQRDGTLAPLLEIFKSFPADFFADGRRDPPPEPVPDWDAPDDFVPPKKVTRGGAGKRAPKARVKM